MYKNDTKFMSVKILIKTKGRKSILTYRIYTYKDKPSRVNKETKILSKYDVKIHRVNWLKLAILRLKLKMMN